MKAFVELPFIDTLHSNLSVSPQFIQVILGPRQVGKTTSIDHYLRTRFGGHYHSVSADKMLSTGYDWLLENWQTARAMKSLLVIDEIQKIENWSEIVKKLWDEEKKRAHPIQCVLLGSSSLDIQRGLTESLTGRFQLIRAHHWNASESLKGYGVDFEAFLEVGGYPGSYDLNNNRDQWAEYVQKSIVETVIEKDILSNHTVKSPALFRQAFELLMSYPAQEISYTKLLGQLQDRGNTELVKNYIRLYEGAFLVKALEKYSTSKIKVRSSSPKILPLCPAFYHLGLRAPYDKSERGRAFEVAVGAQLVRTGQELYSWREGNHEVDFVLRSGKKIWGIEVKSGRKKNVNGLVEFRRAFPQAMAVVIHPENYSDFENNPMEYLKSVV